MLVQVNWQENIDIVLLILTTDQWFPNTSLKNIFPQITQNNHAISSTALSKPSRKVGANLNQAASHRMSIL